MVSDVRVLAVSSMGGAGHLLPLLPFLDAARRRGDAAAVLAPSTMADQLRHLDAELFLGDEPPEEVVAPIRELLAVAPPEQATLLAERELFARFAAGALLPAVRAAITSWHPDLLLREPCEYASAVALPPDARAATVAIGSAAGEARCLEVAAPVLEEQRPGLVEKIRSVPYLTSLPASLDPSPWPVTVRYRRPARAPSGPLPDFWGGRRGPLVYLTLGTVTGYLAGATELYRALVDAVADLPVDALLTTGRHLDPVSIGPTPANVHVEAWLDQTAVLGEADLVVCHGGSGTVWGSLAAGVPLVVVPAFADQAANGRLVAEAGAGLLVETPGGEDGRRHLAGRDEVPLIRQAVGTVLADHRYRDAARELATELSAAQPVEEVLAGLGS